jgi:hypothetical protein
MWRFFLLLIMIGTVLLIGDLIIPITSGVFEQSIGNYTQGEWAQSNYFTWANQLTGPFRLIIQPLLLFLNPPTGQLYKTLVPSEDWLTNLIVQAHTIQWWVMAPWIVIGILYGFRHKRTHLLMFLPYIVAFVLFAYLRNGVNPESARFRDSLIPFAALMFGMGVDRFIIERRLSDRWIVHLLYMGAVAMGLLLMIRAFM